MRKGLFKVDKKVAEDDGLVLVEDDGNPLLVASTLLLLTERPKGDPNGKGE